MKTGINSDLESTSNILVSLNLKFTISLILFTFIFSRIPACKRAGAVKVQSKGFFSGAKVTRGRDWKWDDQDGGSGRIGTLTEITAWSNVERAGAKVIWNILRNNTYRAGYQGSVRIIQPFSL